MNSDEKVWFAARITARATAAEAIEFALNEADALGTEIDILGAPELPDNLDIVGYFEMPPDEENLKFQISNALQIYGLPADSVKEISIQEIENRDWLAEWKKHWRPTETARFIIAPTWEEIPSSAEKIVIRIEPSMAFGTGTHETTRLCLRAIEENYAGESFFDVGTGTGILAIAAAKIKSGVRSRESGVKNTKTPDSRLQTPDSILACDTDEDSIKIARANAELNGARDIVFYVGSIDENAPQFDFLCANLTADVIVPLLPLLVKKTRKTLLLSGILKEQEERIAAELGGIGVTDYELRTDGEWISIKIEFL